MSSLSGKFDPRIGLIITVGVYPSDVSSISDKTPIHAFPAMVDTGATCTCISPIVAERVGLKPIGKRQMASATHVADVNSYRVRIVLPFGNSGIILPPDFEIMEFNAAKDGPCQILLGRDVLCLGVLTMSFDGHFTFSV